MPLPLLASAALGLSLHIAAGLQEPKDVSSVHPPKSIRYSSYLAPGYRPQLPALGARGVEAVRVGPGAVAKLRADEQRLWGRFRPKEESKNEIRKFGPSDRVLVVYDHWGQYKFLGELYSRQMADLLSHYGYDVDLVPAEDYKFGMITSHRATFYMGVLFDTKLDGWFQLEALAGLKPVCWIGSNLWKVAWNQNNTPNQLFEALYGFRFEGMDAGFTQVSYKGEALGKYDESLARIRVLDKNRARVVATATSDEGETMPYIVKSGNLTFVADNPLSTVAYEARPLQDRTLAFCDVVHDVLNDRAPTTRKALIRIEDVSAMSNPDSLRTIADILSSENVPFVVSTIPVYRDPLGYWSGGVPVEYSLDMAPAVVDALKYMERKGGQVIQHGTTHQLDSLLNPVNAISGTDYEFFRVLFDEQGQFVYVGPVWGDSAEWVKDRVDYGRSILQRCGFNPKGWLTPHYLASPTDYDYFAKSFDYSLCPTMTFTTDSAGYLFYLTLNAPFPTRDARGAAHLPETLSYIQPATPNMDPETMIRRARTMKIVRDGWAGLFFHPFLDPELMRTAVKGVKAEGFTFVKPDKALAPSK